MKHYFSLILKSYSLSLSLWNHWTRFSNHFFFYWILFSQSDSVNLQNVRYTSEQTRTEEWVWYVDSSGSCVVCEENARFRDEIVDEKSNFLCFSVFEDDTSTQIKGGFRKKDTTLRSFEEVRIPSQSTNLIYLCLSISPLNFHHDWDFLIPKRNSDKNALSLPPVAFFSNAESFFFRTTTTSLLTNLLLSRYFYHTKNIIILTIQNIYV